MRVIRSLFNITTFLTLPLWGGLAILVMVIYDRFDQKKPPVLLNEYTLGKKWMWEE